MLSNLLKSVASYYFDPHRVTEVQESDYASKKKLDGDDLLTLYDTSDRSGENYEILLKAKNRLLGVYRTSDSEAAQVLFLLLQVKVPELLRCVPDLLTSQVALQSVVQAVEENPSWSSAHVLAHLGYTECFKTQEMQRLLSQSCGDSFVTPLHIAVRAQKRVLVTTLLEQGAPLDARDVDGNTPLHYALLTPDEDTELVELLVYGGVDVVNVGGESALHLAAQQERLGSAMLLLSHSAKPDLQDGPGDTPLHIALKKGCLPLVHALVVFGADLELLNGAGESPRHCAATSTSPLRAELLYALHVVGAARCREPHHTCNEGCSPKGQFNGVPPEQCNFFKTTETLLEELLLSRGQNPNVRGRGEEEGLRLLCLDGGGVKGLVLIQMLGELQRALGRPVLSCFDLVSGTSTGGILALALAAGKSVDECRCLYFRLKDKVFVGIRPYNTDNFESFLKNELGQTTRMGDIEEPMVMVTATRGDRYPAELHLFRNYSSPVELLGAEERDPLTNERMPDYKGELVWKVARATGAAPTYFRPSGRFIDGGLVANNPTLDTLTELHHRNEAFRAAGRAECARRCRVVVSLGTGRPPLSKATPLDLCLPTNVVDACRMVGDFSNFVRLLIDQASQTNGCVTSRAAAFCKMQGVPYFRLNPLLSEDVGLDETRTEVLVRVLWETTAYMRCLGQDLVALKELLLLP